MEWLGCASKVHRDYSIGSHESGNACYIPYSLTSPQLLVGSDESWLTIYTRLVTYRERGYGKYLKPFWGYQFCHGRRVLLCHQGLTRLYMVPIRHAILVAQNVEVLPFKTLCWICRWQLYIIKRKLYSDTLNLKKWCGTITG